MGKPALPDRGVATTAANPENGRLLFLDGIRGAAALYVLMFHLLPMDGVHDADYSRPVQWMRSALDHGHFSVVVFIVLSGFSLMLPLARKDSRVLASFSQFMRRRALRILPPYYASLAFAAACLVAYRLFVESKGGQAPEVATALSWTSVTTHLLLIHNWWFELAFRINAPAWSVATEWQIYFLFALVLLPLVRRLGMALTATIAWLLGALPFYLLPEEQSLYWASPWFLGSFTCGMWAAEIACRMTRSVANPLLPWGRIPIAGAVGFPIVWAAAPGDIDIVGMDFLVTIAASLAIVGCTTSRQESRDPLEMVGRAIRAVFESRILVQVGAYSYSLYLVHHPILRLSEKLAGNLPFAPDVRWLGHFVVGGLASVAIGWLFSEFFERPCTGGGTIIPRMKAAIERSRK